MGVTTLEATTYTTLQAAVHALVAAALGTAFTLGIEGASQYGFGHVWIYNSQVKTALLAGSAAALVFLYLFLTAPSRKLYLLDFHCFVRPKEYLCQHSKLMKYFKDAQYYPDKLHNWFEKLLANSGLGEETVIPECVLDQIGSGAANIDHSVIQRETEWVCCDVVDNLLKKTGVHSSEVGIIITTLSCYTPTPSLGAMLINRFGFSTDVLSYSLGGMGCSASVIGVDMAKHLLRSNPNKLALLVCHENVSNNTYTGQDPSMLITNAIFRMGGAAVLLSNRPKDRSTAKYDLKYSRRSHFAADDDAYQCMGIQEDAEGRKGVYLKKDVVKVANVALNKHIKAVAPYILPLRQLVKCVVDKTYAAAPNFSEAFDHILLHCGGKAIVDGLEVGLKLTPEMTQPTRDALWRFGNTSSASTWYVLARIESSSGVKKGERIWHLSFGGGFKANTAVWKARKDVLAAHPCWE